MRRIAITFMLSIFLTEANAREKGGFEIFGDVMQILPLAMMTYSYIIDDIQGIKEQALGAGGTLATTFLLKYGFVALSDSSPSKARISQRPNNGSFDGFPSGHTSFAFSAVGFSLKRYGWKIALPTGIIATSVGLSRIQAERHTTIQVISGAILGFSFSYFLTSKRNKDSQISMYVSESWENTFNYHMVYMKRF